MELDERKVKILNAVIKNYLETGEPVGSRTISKESDLKLSSATIRNEMADLEEMGYIIQPHTSSGRIPTDAGYRLYVDNMMKEKIEELDKKEKDLNEVKDYLTGKVEQVEELLQNTALLCVIVVEGNVIKNKIIDIVDTVSSETILKLNILFNTSLNGLSLEEMNISLVSMMTAQAPEYSELVRQIIDVVGHALANENDFKIYTSGATNIFKYPELSESSTASEIINTFEEKKLLTNLLVDKNGDEEQSGIQVYIGNETPVSSMKDCSVVTATYEIEDGVTGTIGIIGPKRMDYEKVVKALKSVTDELDDKLGNHDK